MDVLETTIVQPILSTTIEQPILEVTIDGGVVVYVGIPENFYIDCGEF